MNEQQDKGNIILYQTPDGQSKIEVTLSGDTVWLTADQMAELFQRNKSTISRHIKNVFEEGELQADMVVNPEKPDVPINKNDAFQKVQKRRVQEKR